MVLKLRPLFCCVAFFVSLSALAQSPSGPAVPAPMVPAPPPVHSEETTPVVPAPDDESTEVELSRAEDLSLTPLPVRERRRFAVLGEWGWNSLSGLGANFLFRPNSRLSLDAGIGVGAVGIKGGVRARWNVLTTRWTPTFGGGFLMGSGSFGESLQLGPSTPSEELLTFRVRPSPYLQFLGGVEFTAESGFTFLATGGYAVLLGRNLEMISGTPSTEQELVLRFAYGSSLVLSAAIGYSF